MSDLSIRPVTSAIIEIVTNSPAQRVLGARLGAMLKAARPDFNPAVFNCRSLREFIRTCVPEVEEKGRSGPDFLYGLASGAKPHQMSFPVPTTGSFFVPPPTTAFNWRAFTNPSYPYLLNANTETGEFKVTPLGVEVSPPWLQLAKPTPDDHLAIARAFLSTLDDTQRASLESLLSNPKWFLSFSVVAKRLNLASAWGSFRTAQLRARFEEAIREARIPQKKASAVDTSLRIPATSAIEETAQTGSEIRLRDIVTCVVGEMSIDELRELRLPVGRVLDLLLHR